MTLVRARKNGERQQRLRFHGVKEWWDQGEGCAETLCGLYFSDYDEAANVIPTPLIEIVNVCGNCKRISEKGPTNE